MINKKSRCGNFTSSKIVALTKKTAAYQTYIDECNMERRLGRSLTSEVSARPTSWGNLVERRVFDLLGLEYTLDSDETLTHPEFNFWRGSPDGFKKIEKRTVFDIKCPSSLKSFCELVDGLSIEAVRENHKDGDKYYWQLVSNAIISDCDYAELIVYVPYKSELDIIRELAQNFEGDQNKVAWVNWALDNDLPYLIEGNHYKNLNIIPFEVKKEDKEYLTERVKEASKLLINLNN